MSVLFPRLAARALVLWLLTRCLVVVAFALADMPPLRTGVQAAIGMALLLGGIAAADIARRRERAWFDNLGVGRLNAVAMMVAVGALAEVLLSLAVAVA